MVSTFNQRGSGVSSNKLRSVVLGKTLRKINGAVLAGELGHSTIDQRQKRPEGFNHCIEFGIGHGMIANQRDKEPSSEEAHRNDYLRVMGGSSRVEEEAPCGSPATTGIQ